MLKRCFKSAAHWLLTPKLDNTPATYTAVVNPECWDDTRRKGSRASCRTDILEITLTCRKHRHNGSGRSIGYDRLTPASTNTTDVNGVGVTLFWHSPLSWIEIMTHVYFCRSAITGYDCSGQAWQRLKMRHGHRGEGTTGETCGGLHVTR